MLLLVLLNDLLDDEGLSLVLHEPNHQLVGEGEGNLRNLGAPSASEESLQPSEGGGDDQRVGALRPHGVLGGRYVRLVGAPNVDEIAVDLEPLVVRRVNLLEPATERVTSRVPAKPGSLVPLPLEPIYGELCHVPVVGHPGMGGLGPLGEQSPLTVDFASSLQLDAVERTLGREVDGRRGVAVRSQ